jgi:hypothetical protein
MVVFDSFLSIVCHNTHTHTHTYMCMCVVTHPCTATVPASNIRIETINTLRTGDTDLRLYITTVQDG